MQKTFLQNIFLLLAINILIKPLYIFGIDAQVQNAVGASSYGIYFTLFNFCYLFQVILDCGIQNFNSRHVAQNKSSVFDHFSFVAGTKLFLVVIFLFAVFAGALIVGFPDTYYTLLFWVSGIMILNAFQMYLRSHFSALGDYRMESWLSSLDKGIMILVIGYFIYVEKNISIPIFLKGQLCSVMLAILITAILLNFKFRLSLRFSLKRMKALLKQSFPFAVVFLLMTLYTRMDAVMLERILKDEGVASGIYAAGYRILDAGNMLGYLFALLLLPMFSDLLGRQKNVNPLVGVAAKLLLSFTALTCLIAWFYCTEIMDLIYVDATPEYANVFKYLMVSFFAMTLSYVYGALITASGRLRTFNLIFVVGIVINWGLNLLLIPSLEALGAVYSTLATQFFVFFAQVVLASSRFNLKIHQQDVLNVVALLGIYFAIVYYVKAYLPVNWMIQVLSIGIIGIIVSFLLGFLRFNIDFLETNDTVHEQ